MKSAGHTSARSRLSLDDSHGVSRAAPIEISVDSYHLKRTESALSSGRSFAACFVILWIGLMFAGRDRMLRDPGTLWHTVIGERMLETHEWITTDPFSFTFGGRPWIAQQWLAECAMALVHRAAGLDGLLLCAVTILAATLAWVFARLRRARLQWPAAALLLGLVIAASSYHFHPRPHLVTIALTAWTLGWLTDIEAGRRSPKWLLVLPPIMAVWTNVHGGALAGIASTILVLIVWALSSVYRSEKAPTCRSGCSVPLCALVAAVSGLAMFVNPYGVDMLKVWLALSTSKVLPHVISEHGPVAIASVEGVSIVALGLSYMVILASCPRCSIRTTWLIPLIWLPMAFLRVRHGPLFAVTAAIIIAEMWPISRMAQRLGRVGPAIVDAAITRRASRTALAMCGGLVATSFMLQLMGIRIPVIGAGWATLNTGYWPVKATDAARGFINKHPSHNRIFNDMLFGGYLISELPQAKVYIDDRCELYGDDFLLHYVDVLRHPPCLDEEAAARQIDLIMVRPDSRIASYLSMSDAWNSLYKDTVAALFTRRESASHVAHP